MSTTTEITSELLPCPFCAGEATLHPQESFRAMGAWISCQSCGLEGPTETGVTNEDAIAAWNRRPQEQVEPVGERLLNAVYHAIEAAYVRGVEWNEENPLDPEFRFKAARDFVDKAFHDPDSELCKALASSPTPPVSEPVIWRVSCSNLPDEWFSDEGSADQWANSPGHFDTVVTPLYAAPLPQAGVEPSEAAKVYPTDDITVRLDNLAQSLAGEYPPHTLMDLAEAASLITTLRAARTRTGGEVDRAAVIEECAKVVDVYASNLEKKRFHSWRHAVEALRHAASAIRALSPKPEV